MPILARCPQSGAQYVWASLAATAVVMMVMAGAVVWFGLPEGGREGGARETVERQQRDASEHDESISATGGCQS